MPELSPAKPDEVTRVLERLWFTRFAKVEATLFITMLMEGGQQYRCIKAEI